jgi:hypothetical protein
LALFLNRVRENREGHGRLGRAGAGRGWSSIRLRALCKRVGIVFKTARPRLKMGPRLRGIPTNFYEVLSHQNLQGSELCVLVCRRGCWRLAEFEEHSQHEGDRAADEDLEQFK